LNTQNFAQGQFSWEHPYLHTYFGYDQAGNIRMQGDRSYQYDPNNRLIGISEKNQNTNLLYPQMAPLELGQYVHNGHGERVSKMVDGISTLFFYDQSGNIVGEYDQQGNALREHVYGLTGRLATNESGATYWHHNDHLGTPQKMTDNSATIVWNAIYQAFGKAEVNEDPDGDGITVTNNFRFPSQYFDAESGLHYNYFRSYDPDTGRYTQADPIGLNGGG